MDDEASREDEIVSIISIFGEETVHQVRPAELKLGIPTLEASPRLECHLFLPADYPSSSPPIASLHSPILDSSSIETLAQQLERLYIPGEVVLFSWIQFLQEEWQQRAPPPPPPPPPTVTVTIPITTETTTEITIPTSTQERNTMEYKAMAAKIVHGHPITEKKSTFQAHLAPITHPSEVKLMLDVLLQNSKIRDATHNIMAYRIETRPGNFASDCDDDGEDAAGGRLLHLLNIIDARNVAVVVSRWFGGILLGPARFGLINKAAKDVLEVHGGSGGAAAASKEKTKSKR